MLTQVLRLALALTLLTALLIGLTYAQPDDNPMLRAFLLPPAGCAPPCFLNVRPGHTPSADAVALLENHAWIETVEPSSSFYDLVWSGAQPAFIDAGALSYLLIAAGRVDQIRLRTILRLGDVVALLGAPDEGAAWLSGSSSGVFHTVWYHGLGLEIGGYAACPARYDDLWHMPVEVRIADHGLVNSTAARYRRPHLPAACR
jgi:hypothetical protein